MKSLESFFRGCDGRKLFYQSWPLSTEPKKQSRGLVVITHGQGEHTESYHRIRSILHAAHYDVIAWDLRGHGRSYGARGEAPSFDYFVRDYECFLRQVIEPLQKDSKSARKNTIYLAHSMGALVHLKHFLSEPSMAASKQILSSPLLGLDFPGLPSESPLLRSFLRLVPRFQFFDWLSAELCSQDPAVQEEYRKDLLRHTRLAGHLVAEALEVMETVHKRASLLTSPFLLLLPERDPLVDTKASLQFFKATKNPQGILRVYKNRRHELFNDIGRDEVFADVTQFISS